MSDEKWFTVNEVGHAFGLEPDKHVHWCVGNRMRELWEREMSEPVRTERRPKTFESGNHSKAIYPPLWFARIVAALEIAGAQKRRQGDMFG